MKYLAGAYRAANGDHNRAVAYYASGYYYAAKRQRLAHIGHSEPVLAGTPTKEAVVRRQRTAGSQVSQGWQVQTGGARVDTLPHRPTLALFRGELR